MNIALIGYGKMNKAVETQAVARSHTVTLTIDTPEELLNANFSAVDVAFEFSTPDSGFKNAIALIEKNVTTVSGTTGWSDKLSDIQSAVQDADCGFLWSPNFSIGVQMFWKIVADATKHLNAFSEYDMYGHEFHHAKKADSPSGTALKTAEIIVENSATKDSIVTEELSRMRKPNELHFSSTRGGSVPGTHKVFFDSPADTIEISHTARSSEGFALGAVLAAEWLSGKKGFFTMDDFLADLTSAA